MNATFDTSTFDISTFEKISDYIQNNQIISLIIGLVIAGGIIFLVAKKLMTMSVRILLGILTIVFTLFMGPKLSIFILNTMNQCRKFDDYMTISSGSMVFSGSTYSGYLKPPGLVVSYLNTSRILA